MPVVAQINVNFAGLPDIQNRSGGNFQQIDDKAVNPLSLAKYCLWNREDSEFRNGQDSAALLRYDGGFITAGDRINVKHDSDLQLRQSLDVGRNIYTEFIHSRRKNNGNADYLTIRAATPRSITLAPNEGDVSDKNFIRLTSDSQTRSITLYANYQTTQNSILINSGPTSGGTSGERIDITSPEVNIAKSGAIDGVVNITSFLNVRNDTKINSDKFVVTASNGLTQIAGNLNVGSTTTGTGAYGNFTVDSTSGNTVSKGTLDVTGNTILRSNVTIQGNNTTTSPNFERFIINDGSSDKFTVISASGNTDIQGTLNVVDNVTLQKNVTIAGTNNTVTPETFNITDGTSDVFTVISANGNTDIKGTLRIDTNKFVVNTGTGNTTIAGTLGVTSTSTFTNNITLNGGTNNNSTNRRIIGARRLADVNEFNGTTYDEDVITFFDFKRFGFKKGMIMMWSPISPDNYSSNFNSSGLGVNNMSGWAVCNGNNSTVNLVNKFVIGGRASDGLTVITGSATSTGGSKDAIVVSHSHTASSNSTGSHTHTATDKGHTHDYNTKSSVPPQSGKSTPSWFGSTKAETTKGYADITVETAGAHSHTITVDTEGSDGTNQNLPPYYSLIYIMKIT